MAAAISGHMTGRNGQTPMSLVGVLRNVPVSRMLAETLLVTHAGQRTGQGCPFDGPWATYNPARHWLAT